jgi:hypothetical protein
MVKPNRCSVSIGSARALPGTSENASSSQHPAVQRRCAAETSRPDVFGIAIEASRPRVGFAALHSNRNNPVPTTLTILHRHYHFVPKNSGSQ